MPKRGKRKAHIVFYEEIDGVIRIDGIYGQEDVAYYRSEDLNDYKWIKHSWYIKREMNVERLDVPINLPK